MTNNYTDKDIQEIREADEKRTQGDWVAENLTDVFSELGQIDTNGRASDNNDGWQIADCDVGRTFVDGELTELEFDEKNANAQFIALAPKMADIILQQQKRIEELVGENKKLNEILDEQLEGIEENYNDQ